MLQYFLYNTLYGNTIVDYNVNPFSPFPPLAQVQLDFDIPAIQPPYLYAIDSGITAVIINSQTNIDNYLNATQLPPTPEGNVTYGQYSATTQQQNQAISGLTTIVSGITATTGLQQVTQINAQTNIESTFNGGLRTNHIRPTGDTTTAIQINKADGTTHIINVDTISGFTGFGTIAPKSLVHSYGVDNTGDDGWNYQKNAFRVDGAFDADKDIQWADQGSPKFTAQIYRCENGKYWYLSSPQGQVDQFTVSQTGRIGVNNQTNLLNSHAILEIGGPNDLVVSGVYTQNYTTVYEIEIDSTGVTDTFRWRSSINQGYTFGAWSPSIDCDYSPYEIEYGVLVFWNNITGHTLGTTWIFGAFAQLPIGTFIITPNAFAEVQTTDNDTANPIIYTDVTAAANSSSYGSLVDMFNVGQINGAVYFGTLDKLNTIFVNIIVAGQGIALAADYWDGNSWINLTTPTNSYNDQTSNLTKSGSISWENGSMTGWIPAYMPDLSGSTDLLYWIRLRTTTNPTVQPVANSFARGGNYRLAVLASPSDFKPSMYIDSLGRTSVGGGNITGNNLLQINQSQNVPVGVGDAPSLVEFDSENATSIDLKLKLATNDACSPGIILGKTRGTLASGCNVQYGDKIGHICFKTRVNNVGIDLNTITSQYYGDGTTCCGDMIFSTGNGTALVEKVRISGIGTGFGVSIPTAQIHIAAGTTSVAPLKFTSGSLLSAPQAGAVEFLTDAYYGTITTGSARRTFAFLESPQFTGNPELPTGTCLNNVNLCNFILNSGGTNNNCLVSTSAYNAFTACTAQYAGIIITGATNGICKYNNNNICLGGLLTSPLILCGNQDICLLGGRIDIASACGAQIYDKNGCSIEFYSSGGTVTIKGMSSLGVEEMRLQISNTQATFTDSRAIPKGVEYNADYSSTFGPNSLVSRTYVDIVATGLQVHEAVEVATTTAIVLSGLTTIDSVQLTTGMRVLVKNQSSGATNGVYSASTGIWGRTSDFDGSPFGEVVSGAYMAVISGATNKNTSWILTTPNPIYIGITPLTFVLFNTTQGTVAGNGICVTSAGGNYNVSVKLANNCGLCSDASGLYVNSAIAGTGLQYTTGVINLNGSSLAGNSICWSGNSFNVDINHGSLSTALSNKLNTSIYQTYTGTTAPNAFASKSFLSTYTGTTVPNTYQTIANVSHYTGTTAPNAFASKSFVSSYTATTNSTLSNKAYISGVTFTGKVCVCTPSVNDNTNCAINSAWYIGQCGTATPLMDGIGTIGSSALWAHQDHVHPRDTNKLSCSGGTMTGTLKGTIFSGNTCVASPVTIGTTCVCSPVVLGSTCVCSPIACGSTCVISPITIGSTCVCGPVILGSTSICSPIITGSTKICSPCVYGTTCVCGGIVCATTVATAACTVSTTCLCSPIILGSTSICSPLHCGACGYFSTAVCSPVITGSTKVCSPIVCATTCSSSPLHCGACIYATTIVCSPIITGSTKVCSPIVIATSCVCIATTPPAATISEPTLFYNSTSKVIEAKQLTGGTDNYNYCDCATNCATTCSTCIKYIGFCPTNMVAGRYQVDFNAQVGNATANACSLATFKIDGTTQGGDFLGRINSAGWILPNTWSKDATFTAATHCFEVFIWAGSGTACMPTASIRIKRIC